MSVKGGNVPGEFPKTHCTTRHMGLLHHQTFDHLFDVVDDESKEGRGVRELEDLIALGVRVGCNVSFLLLGTSP